MERDDEYLNNLFSRHLTELNEYTQFSKKTEIDFLYHYTDINGFLGIFDSKSLWASNAFFLNDSSEINYGLDLSNPFLESFYSSLKDEKTIKLLSNFKSDFPGFLLNSNLFLISFCEDGDLLSQWRGYSKMNDGVSINFHLPALRSIKSAMLHKVIYEKETQEKLIKNLIDLLNDLMEYESRESIKSFISYFNLWLSVFTTMILTLKDKSFCEEKEWRIIYNHDSAINKRNIEYRIKDKYIMPYVKLENLDIMNTITNITVGPSANSKIIEKSIKYYCDMKYYENISVTQSKIPYRR